MTKFENLYHGYSPESEILKPPDVSFGTFYPENAITNEGIESWDVKTASGRSITANGLSRLLGIERRFVALPHQDQHYMGFMAAQDVLRNAQAVDRVYVTSSYPTGKNIAESIVNEFDMPKSTQYLDFYAACSGFAATLSYMHQNYEEHAGANVLLVSTEKYSDMVEDLRSIDAINRDPSLAQTIFSDGAVAMQFQFGKDLKTLYAKDTPLDSSLRSVIRMPISKDKMNLARPYCTYDVPYSEKFSQNGSEVIKAVGENVPTEIDLAVWKSGSNPSRIKQIIPHQGSRPVLQKLEENILNLYLGDEYKGKLMYDLEDGNFSSASIPKATKRAIEEKKIQKGDEVVMAGFGAGLFASTVVVKF